MQQAKADTLRVSIAPSGTLRLDVGQAVTLTANPSGGTGPYTDYQWYVDGGAVSGETGATYYYAPSSPSSVSITVTVTDSSPATSDPSSPISVITAASPTVSIAPFGPLTLDAGLSQLFTATPNAGTGIIHYHWYIYHWSVGATTFDSDSNTYFFNQAAGSYSVTCTITDSANPPVSSPSSNSISITVNPALSNPAVEASAGTINRGQNSMLSATGISGGTTPYHYQWLSEAPGASSYSAIGGATSSTYIFSTTGATALGTWRFELQVTDSADTLAIVTSSAAQVEVCPIISFTTSPTMAGDASGTVLSIDTVPYTYNDLQTLQFSNWKTGSTHAIVAASKVSVIGGAKQYAFHDWTNGNGLVTATGVFTTPNADTTVTVNYTPQYQIVVAPPSNGQITPGSTAFYDAGNTQVFSINAYSGYHISGVIIDGTSVGTNSFYAFNSISTHHTISAAFAPDSPSQTPTPQPTPSPSPTPSTTPSPTATPTPTTSPPPTTTPTPTPTPTSASIATAIPTPTPMAPAQTPLVDPTTAPPTSKPPQPSSSTQTAAPIKTPRPQTNPSTSGILTGELAGMLAFIVAILVIAVLVFKKGKR